MIVWQADNEILQAVEQIKNKHHLPRLDEASVAVCFNDSKAFVKGKLNWGKVQKFSNQQKIWHQKKYDFLITLSADVWHSILDQVQREALLDLHLRRCQVEYLPILENKKPVKDEWGRVQLSTDIKRDEDGVPKWRVSSFGIEVFAENIRTYGLWCEPLLDVYQAIEDYPKGKK